MDEFVMDLLAFVNEKLCESGDKLLKNDSSERDPHLEAEFHRNEGINSCCIDFMEFIIKRYDMQKKFNIGNENEDFVKDLFAFCQANIKLIKEEIPYCEVCEGEPITGDKLEGYLECFGYLIAYKQLKRFINENADAETRESFSHLDIPKLEIPRELQVFFDCTR